jgi:tetratricopeptide (TPR) repeat protein
LLVGISMFVWSMQSAARADDAPATTNRDAENSGIPASTVAPSSDEPGIATEPPAEAPRPGVSPSAPVLRPDAALSDDERYRRGKNLFEYGDCESVVDVMSEFSIGGARGDEDRLAEAHRMLGICYFQLGRRAEAERELKSLLYLNPDYVLDAFLTPPPVVELFDELKSGMREKLDDVRKARESTRKETQRTKTLVVEKTTRVAVTPWPTVLMPFGLSQAANGQLLKGVLFGLVQAGFVVANVGAWALVQALRPAAGGAIVPVAGTVTVGGSEVSLQAILAQLAWVAMATTLSAFAVAYLAGVGDAWWNHEDEAVLDVTESPPRAAVLVSPLGRAKLDVESRGDESWPR